MLARESGPSIVIRGKLTVALAYPKSYAVGMSSLGLQILYRLFTSAPRGL